MQVATGRAVQQVPDAPAAMLPLQQKSCHHASAEWHMCTCELRAVNLSHLEVAGRQSAHQAVWACNRRACDWVSQHTGCTASGHKQPD